MSNNKNILIINGPNLNLLGGREKDIYGQDSLQDIENKCREKSSKLGLEVDFFQSNSESELVDKIQNSKNNTDLVIINAAAYTHTSVAIHDALRAIDKPIIEVHLQNHLAPRHILNQMHYKLFENCLVLSLLYYALRNQ
jgi:3-dehydroquinate dehydratase-2